MLSNSINSTSDIFYYITEVDLSLDNGPGINEWEFVSKLTELFPNKFVCFAPQPSRLGARLCPKVQYVSGHRGFHPIFYLIFQVDLLKALLVTARRRRPSALVVRPGVFPLVPLIFARWLNVPLFIKTLGMGSLTTLPERYFPLGRYLLYPLTAWVYHKLLQRAQLIDVVSTTYINWAMEMFGLSKERLVVIPNGVNEKVFFPQPRDQAGEKLGLSRLSRAVGFVGSLTWYCGVDRLVEAGPAIIARFPDTIFVVAGDGRKKQRLEELAKERGVQDHFLFRGHIPYENVAEYINTFDVAVILWPSERMQEVGSSAIKLREYLACGCPVVASRGDGHAFIERNKLGWLVVPEDPKQVADAICAGLSLTSEERENMSKRSREYAVANFSTANLVSRRYELWVNALQSQE